MEPTALPIDWMSLLVIAATAGVMIFLLRRLMRGMNQQDWILLRQAKTRGVDMTQPHAVDFVVFAATHETALELSELMRRDGFDTSVKVAHIQYARRKKKPGAAQEGWLVKGSRQTRLVPEELIRTRKHLTEIALARKAIYLGWQVGPGVNTQTVPRAPR